MPGYADTKKLIEDTLVNRPAGSVIMPEDHENFALSMLDYIHSVELLGASSLQGTATVDTVPVQPIGSRVSYISSVPPGQTYVYTNFLDENGQAISVTSGANTVSLLTLLWNGSYWTVSSTPVTLAVDYTNGYLFKGVAVPSTNPGAPDQNVFYIAGAGTYQNFGGLTVPDGYIGLLEYNGSWAVETLQAGDVNAVKFVAQTLTNAQKAQARTNIEAASNEQVSQLEHEVHNLSGKYYGVHATIDTLPEDADAPGYAFVGAQSPYAIWNFDGEEWSDSGSVANGITGEPGVGFSSIFTPQPYDGTVIIVLSNNDTITLNLNHSHPEYFSKIVGNAIPSGGFLPDVVYKLGTLTDSTLRFTLAAEVSGNLNHYYWIFSTGSSAPSTVNWPSTITSWGGNCIDENTGLPDISASKRYEVSVIDGVAYISES